MYFDGAVVPFYPADSVKIMVINAITDNELANEAVGSSIVVFIEDILRASQTMPFGTVVRWEDWRAMTTPLDFQCFLGQTEDERHSIVAGSRLISPPLDCGLTGFRRLEVYDFNPHYIKFVQATGVENVTILGSGRLKYLKSEIVVPWREEKTSAPCCLVHLTEDHVIIDNVSITNNDAFHAHSDGPSFHQGQLPKRIRGLLESAVRLGSGSDG